MSLLNLHLIIFKQRSSVTNNALYRFDVNVSLKLIDTLRPKINAVADIVGHYGVLDYLKIVVIAVTCEGIIGLSRHVT